MKLFAEREAARRQADLHELGRTRPALGRRDASTTPTSCSREGKGRDRIVICEDTDGDGEADKFTVFADKLSIPTSLAFANGGVIVHQAPHTLFLKDTDGDDKADERKVLFTGWGTGDTHAGPSNLRYGLDNWIYGIVGYSGFDGTVGGERHRFRQGFYRFKPDGSKLEFLRSTNNNSWGVGFSEEGLLFGSTANGNPSVYLPIPNRYYEAVRGWSSTRAARASPATHRIPPDHREGPPGRLPRRLHRRGRPRPVHGPHLPAANTGTAPPSSREPTGHLVATFALQRDGSRLPLAQRLEPARQRRRVDRPDHGRGRARRQRLGDRLVQLHRPAQPDAARASRPARATPTRPTLRDKKHGLKRSQYPA